jgi:hypothetical protein
LFKRKRRHETTINAEEWVGLTKGKLIIPRLAPIPETSRNNGNNTTFYGSGFIT